MPGDKPLKTTGKLIRSISSGSSSLGTVCVCQATANDLTAAAPTDSYWSECCIVKIPHTWIQQQVSVSVNVFSLLYLLLVSVDALWRRFHVPSRRKLPHLGHRKPWEGCLEEVRWGLGEGAYWIVAELQKSCHGAWWGTQQVQPDNWSPIGRSLACP